MIPRAPPWENQAFPLVLNHHPRVITIIITSTITFIFTVIISLLISLIITVIITLRISLIITVIITMLIIYNRHHPPGFLMSNGLIQTINLLGNFLGNEK